MSARSDLIVIGGGLIGMSSAIAASAAGLSVTLLEAVTIGRHASSASAGGVRSLNRHPAEIAMARTALDIWRQAPALFGHDCGYRETGQIRVAEDEDALEKLRKRVALTETLGFAHEKLVGQNDLFQRVPALAGHCLGAIVVDDDGFADPLATVHAFRRTALAAGVRIAQGQRVTAIARDGEGVRVTLANGDSLAAGIVVNAAGAWGARLAAGVGEPVSVNPVALQMTVTEPLPKFVDQTLGTQGRKLSLKQSPNGTVVIGGGFEGAADLDTGDSEMSLAGTARNMANAVRLFPVLADARVVRTWAGIEGIAADELPVLGASRTVPGLIHAFGFSGHGFALSPLVGRLVTALAEGREPGFDLAPFRVERFA